MYVPHQRATTARLKEARVEEWDAAVAHNLQNKTGDAGTPFTCFTGSEVPIPTRGGGMQVLRLLALLVQKYRY